MGQSRIRTPLKQHWLRFRTGALPALAFLIFVGATLWLWNRQGIHSSIVGEVSATQVPVVAGMDGLLADPADAYWQLFDPVSKGQVLARLDDRLIQAQLRTVVAQADQLRAQLDAAETELELDQLSLTQQHARELMRRTWEYERRRLERLRMIATIRSDMADLKGTEASLAILERLNTPQRRIVSETRLIDLRKERDILKTRIDENKKVYQELHQQFLAAKQQMDEYGDLVLPNAETVLAPIRAAIAVEEAKMDEINVQIEQLVITSPIDGVITAIHRWPGQRTLAGDAIVTIAADDSEYVVSFVREKQRVSLTEGMEVGLKLRAPGAREFTSRVAVIGPQVEPVPPHQLHDPNTPEWAIPIKIPIPREMKRSLPIRPGQLLQIYFRHDDIGQPPAAPQPAKPPAPNADKTSSSP